MTLGAVYSAPLMMSLSTLASITCSSTNAASTFCSGMVTSTVMKPASW